MSRQNTALTVILLSVFWCCLLILSCGGNNPPETPAVPQGPTTGNINVTYTFVSSVIDPDEDSVAIRFDWGDGTQSDWSTYVASGAAVSAEHAYTDTAVYEIRAYARDQAGEESDPSAALLIEIGSTGLLFEKTFGGTEDDQGYALQLCSDGTFIIVGKSSSYGAGGSDLYIIKADTTGQDVYKVAYGGGMDDGGKALDETSDNGYIITGFTNSYGVGGDDIYLVKTNQWGNLLWDTTYGGPQNDYGEAIRQTSDNGYIIAGYTNSFGAGAQDVYLIKTDANGGLQWSQTYGGSGSDVAYAVQQTTDGGYIVAGYTTSYGAGGGDVYLIKTDSNGDTSWTKTIGTSAWERANDILQTGDGGYIIAAGNGDAYIIKTDGNGAVSWEAEYGGSGTDFAESIYPTSDGGYVVAGYTNSTAGGDYDLHLLKINSGGSLIWERTFGGSYSDYGYAVLEITGGNIIAAGYTNSVSAGGYDFYVIKTAP